MRTLKAKEGYIMTKTLKLTAYECGTLKAQIKFAIVSEEKHIAKMKSLDLFTLADDIADSEIAIETFKSIIDKIDKAEYKD